MDIRSYLPRDRVQIITIILLIAIFAVSFYVRSLPARHEELQAIDPFYIYRMSEYVVNNGFTMPELDMMRHHPFGVDPRSNTPVPFYLPAIMYYMIGPMFGLDYFHFALLYPAIMGALAAVAMYFVGKELFDRNTGLMAAFFLGVVPAFITRTSAGFFDKEASAGLIMMALFYFFIRAYKRNDWKSGIVGGLIMLLLTETWAGGMQYISLLIPGFVLILMLLNKDIDRITKSFLPILFGALATLALPYHPDLLGFSIYSTLPLVGAILLIRLGIEKFNLVKREQLPYVVPGILIIGFIGMAMSFMFTDVGTSYFQVLIRAVSLERGTVFSTVAEANPGSWQAIEGVTRASYASNTFGIPESLIGIFSITTFMLIGMLIMAFEFVRGFIDKARKVNWLLFFALFWMISSIWAVLGFIRLLFLLGPPAALMSAYFIGRLIYYAKKTKPMKEAGFVEKVDDAVHHKPGWKRKLNYVSIPLGVFIVLILVINTSNAYAYGFALGPSLNFYWRQGMDYLANETPEDSNILSWWDFGYWFQTRGKRPTLTDGGFGKRDEVAWWFTASPNNWTDFEPWLKDKYHIDYILMDYTLPGKYGAISKISSDGKLITGPIQFGRAKTYQQGNQTIYEYNAGQYSLWMPMNPQGNNLAGTPMLIVSQGGQYFSRVYINDFCTSDGIYKVGSESNSVPGCVAFMPYGVFFIPGDMENTIFTSMMFMEGSGLPVEKVYDNQLIQIYKVLY